MPSRSNLKLNSVQYLRAAAVLLVVAFHAGGHLGDFQPNDSLLGYGQFGVDLFFVISGFIMVATTAPNSSACTFAAKRLWRIVPLYWLITLSYVVILLVAPNIMRSAVFDSSHIVKSFLFIPSYNPKSPGEIWPLVVPGWSLNYEMYFYAIFTIALFASAQRRCWIAAGALLTFLGIGQALSTKNPVIITYTNTLLLEFLIGVIIGAAFLRKRASITRALSAFLFAIAAASIICTSLGISVWRSVVCGSISGAILSLLLSFEQAGAVFSNATLILIGDASYSIYLTHPAVIGILRHIGNASHFTKVDAPLKLAALVVSLACSILFGWIIFTQIEQRIMILRDMFLKRQSADLVDDAN